MPSPRSLPVLFIVGLTFLLFILAEYLSNFGGVSRHHLKTDVEFPLNLVCSLEVL